MQSIRIPEIDVVTPDPIEPASGESLADYGKRIADQFQIVGTDVVGGASFGGMLAAEIARQRPVAGLILLGSCIRPSRLPRLYRWVEKIGRVVPDRLLGFRSWDPLVRWRFAPITRQAEQCLVAMAASCPPARLRSFGRMIVDWSGIDQVSCPVLSIHGARDRIIPLACAESGLVLDDAGHAFTLTHVEQTKSAIREFLKAHVV
jgi:pimeloyl-ACP methyl ester carboxylesterase